LAPNPFVGNILWPYFDEYTAEVEQQLPQQIVASVLFSRRLNRDNIGTGNSSIPISAYTPVTVTEKTTGKVVQVWLRDPAYSKAPTTNVQFNSALLNTEFSGVEVKLNKRLSNHFSLLGGVSFQRTVAHSSGGDLNNPSNRLFDSGVIVGSIPWSYRFSGAYQAPHGVMVSSTFQYDKGLGELTTVQVGSDTIKFNAGQATTQTVNVAKRDVFLPNVIQLDSSVQKPWRLTERQTISARMDFYNALNNATITNRVTQLGPTYHRINGIQAGRMLKLGLNYQF
jgi:outer membrane receptor protein involved in Fe transport